ncbi:hypothetical protein VW41_07915 [Klebsiella michiganensis]|nr:hypothetical protein VW41_07915 [Klebsiella michiganensis]
MKTVYHYCSAETFLSVIRYKKLWLGDIRYMNDHMEVKWFMEAFKQLLDSELTDYQHKALYKNIIENQLVTKPYISCLSQSGDILSQWRAYAQDGQGIAIGLDSCKLEVEMNKTIRINTLVKNSFYLNKVNYLSVEDVKDLIIKTLNEYPDVLTFFSNENLDFSNIPQELQNRIAFLGRTILHMSLHFKNPAFNEEKEVRLIYNHLPDHHTDKKENRSHSDFLKSKTIRISQGNLTSHYEFPIPNGAISEIIIGPKCKFDIDDVREFAKLSGLSQDIFVEKSKASYR